VIESRPVLPNVASLVQHLEGSFSELVELKEKVENLEVLELFNLEVAFEH
jgi:hypothetical protein